MRCCLHWKSLVAYPLAKQKHSSVLRICKKSKIKKKVLRTSETGWAAEFSRGLQSLAGWSTWGTKSCGRMKSDCKHPWATGFSFPRIPALSRGFDLETFRGLFHSEVFMIVCMVHYVLRLVLSTKGFSKCHLIHRTMGSHLERYLKLRSNRLKRVLKLY